MSGRVLYHERIRAALLRHMEKDLGPLALPRIPPAPQPFTVAEYFPTPGVTPFHDPRQHAVSLAYVVPVEGDCAPQQDALELTWFTPLEARDPACSPSSRTGRARCCCRRWRTSASEGRRERPARAGRRPQAISGTRRWWIASSISAISMTSEPVSWVNRSRMPRTVSAEPSSELRSL